MVEAVAVAVAVAEAVVRIATPFVVSMAALMATRYRVVVNAPDVANPLGNLMSSMFHSHLPTDPLNNHIVTYYICACQTI